jgi:hypothetical protein
MTRKRRVTRPSDPMEMVRRRAAERASGRDPATWGVDTDMLRLSAHRDVDATTDQAGRIVRARRQDIFDLMSGRGRLSPAAVNAVRRLQDDIACLHRTATGSMAFAPRVDRSPNTEGFSESRRRAGARIESVLSLAGPANARLLGALCEPEVVLGRATDWRAVVKRETGEGLSDAQGAILRMACENLAGAYDMVDRRRA